MESDPCAPSLSLLSKLGSIVVHAEEFFSPKGHGFDRDVLMILLADADVQAWIRAMGVYLPVKR
ncbi:MAG: hypothetical protein ACRDL7_00085 [Gaiellaceae bacterium]